MSLKNMRDYEGDRDISIHIEDINKAGVDFLISVIDGEMNIHNQKWEVTDIKI